MKSGAGSSVQSAIATLKQGEERGWVDADALAVLVAHVARLELALRDVQNLHKNIGDVSQPGAIHRAVVVGICTAALEAR